MKDKRTLTYTIENKIAPTLGEWLDIHQFPRKTMKELFGAKAVRLDGQLCTAKSELSQGMILEIIPLKERLDHDSIEMPLTIAYEDEDILIVDKASGITMNSKGQISLANGIAHYFKTHKNLLIFLNSSAFFSTFTFLSNLITFNLFNKTVC